MRPAYGAEETGIGGHEVTIVVDVANVMGSRPDGWWRDRAGAAVRLHTQIARLAASGRAILPDNEPDSEEAPGSAPAFVLVLEGAARAAIARLSPAAPPARPAARPPGKSDTRPQGKSDTRPQGKSDTRPDAVGPGGPAGPPRSGEVRVVEARGSGDDEIVAVVRELPGRRVVVTADRELRARCAAAGAEILGPGWLLGLLRDE
jgi:8-oxo-dGTP diphosphatase